MNAVLVRFKQEFFGFVTGVEYAAREIEGGYAVLNEDGEEIPVPTSTVEVAAKKAPYPPPSQRVSQKPTSSELEALKNAKAVQPTESAKQPPLPKGGGIVSQILSGEQEAPQQQVEEAVEEEEERLTPADEKRLKAERRLASIREKLEPHTQPALKEGQCWLSDLTGGRLPDSNVDHIITAKPADHFPEKLRADIPEFNLHHCWDPNVLEDIHLSYVNDEKLLLTGFPGSGKTTSPEQYCAIVQHPFMKINGKSGIDASAFIGFLWAGPKGTSFEEGLLPVAMRHGYVMVIDEVFKIPPEIQMNFQTVYEESGFLLLDEKPGVLAEKLVKPHPDFRLIATDNARGVGDNFEKFGATQVQDTSTLDRFRITCDVPYLSEADEVKALSALFPEVPDDTVTRFVRIANLVRDGYSTNAVSLTLSMRGLKTMCRLYLSNISEESCFKKVYFAKVGDDVEVDTVQGYLDTVDLDRSVPVISSAQRPRAALENDEGRSESVPWKRSGADVPF